MGTLQTAFSRKRKGAPFSVRRKRGKRPWKNGKGLRSNPVTAVRIRQGLLASLTAPGFCAAAQNLSQPLRGCSIRQGLSFFSFLRQAKHYKQLP